METFDGAQGNEIVNAGDGFSTVDLYIDISQCKRTDNFTEEGGFLMVRFNQGHVNRGRPKFDGDAGKSGTGAQVGGAGLCRRIKDKIFQHRGHRVNRVHPGEEVTGGEEGFAEVAGDDFFFGADGGEVDAGVPAEE